MPRTTKNTRPTPIDDPSIAALLHHHAAQTPDKIAIKHNGQSITYNELEISSNQIAAYLIANHITNNDIVAIAMDRSIKLVACLLGIIERDIQFGQGLVRGIDGGGKGLRTDVPCNGLQCCACRYGTFNHIAGPGKRRNGIGRNEGKRCHKRGRRSERSKQ